ncbi:MAG: nitroreductase family protein [Chloroflexota bacterium]
METMEAILTRRSIRRWQDKPVPEDLLNQILEAGRWSPSAGNYQPWAFIVVQKPETKHRIQVVAEESKNLSRVWSPQYRDGGRRGYIQELSTMPLGIAIFADQRKAPPHTDGEHGHIVSASMAAQNMWLAAHALGLGACLWSHMIADKMRAILGMPIHWDFVGLLGIGYTLDEGSPEGYDTTQEKLWQRKPLEDVTHYDWYGVAKDEDIPQDKLDILKKYLDL